MNAAGFGSINEKKTYRLGSLPWMVLFGLCFVSLMQAQESAGMPEMTGMENPAAAPVMAEPDNQDTGTVLPPSNLLPPKNILAEDVPNDYGGEIQISWEPPDGEIKPDTYILEMSGPDGLWQEITQTVLTDYMIADLQNFTKYRFRVAAVYGDQTILSDPTPEIEPRDHLIRLESIPVMVAIVVFTILLVTFISAARRGIYLYIRRITGLNAVEDAIGRATEMGKPVLYIPGTDYIESISTLASLNILGEIARRTVHYDVKIICPNIDPIVFAIAREIVKETYASEGRPDAFDPDSVFFMVPDQFAYAAGVNGIMVREKPATIFLLGWFMAESLILAETGASIGAVQIAGTDEVSQLPFFITACDYTLIGEELYAASAYLSKEPMLLGTLKAQDYGKLVFIGVMLLLTAIALISGWDAASLVRVR